MMSNFYDYGITTIGNNIYTFNANEYEYYKIQILDKCTIKPTGVYDSNKAYSVYWYIVNGGRERVFWDASIKWKANKAPALSLFGVNVIHLISLGGQTWYEV